MHISIAPIYISSESFRAIKIRTKIRDDQCSMSTTLGNKNNDIWQMCQLEIRWIRFQKDNQ